ncbi:MAG: HEAT repeat domain-containing protein [Terriglobia bacterium]|jgi:hypothetical protein
MNCSEFDESLPLYLYDELPEEQRAGFETHLAACGQCRARLEETQRLHRVLSARPSPEPSPELLVHCRAALEEALDRELAGVSWRSLLEQWASTLRAISRLPAAAALALVVFGFTLGWSLRPRAVFPPGRAGNMTQSSVSGDESDLSNMRINAISQVAPSPQNGEVRITVNAERQMTLQGSLDDPHIREVLVQAVKGYDNPGIRHDSMEVLARQADNPAVRSALLYAIQNDPNTGVRLDALNAAAERMEWCPELRQALLHAVEHDRNAGVRVTAIDLLVGHADQTTLPELERLATSDPDRYVRLKSVAAIRKLQGY